MLLAPPAGGFPALRGGLAVHPLGKVLFLSTHVSAACGRRLRPAGRFGSAPTRALVVAVAGLPAQRFALRRAHKSLLAFVLRLQRFTTLRASIFLLKNA